MQHQPAQVVRISARRGLSELGLGDLWERRELLYFFVWRDIKVRYKQTVFGTAWAVIQPVALMAIFSISIGQIAGIGDTAVPYPLFVLSGLIPWTLFSNGLVGAAFSLVASEAIVTKVWFPRLLLPVASVAANLLDFAVSLVLLEVIALAAGVRPTIAVLALPLVTLLALVSALGLGAFLAALNVRYRDVRYVIPFLVQLMMFSSPVLYTHTLIPGRLQGLYALSPVVGTIEGFRWAILGGPRPDAAMLLSTVSALVLLAIGVVYFARTERSFSDVI
jgi:lipopolysaccharide transport system permease protein